MKIRLFLTLLVFCLCLSSAAQAEGKLREMLRERRQQGASADEEGGGGDTCAVWDAKVKKLVAGRAGARMKGKPADIVDIPYGDKPREKIDVYLPPKGSAPAPVIFMVHGGGWCTGDKAYKGVTAQKVARWVPKGFVLVSVNYPMVGDGLAALQQGLEVARALAYVQQHAAEWGGDAEKIILMGHSAGAHLISLVNADAVLREKAGVKPVLGVVSLDSGAINVVTQMPNAPRIMKTRYKEAFGTDEAGWIAASPFHQLDKTAAPWLGVCSTTRPDKPCEQAEEYAQKSNALGVKADVLPQRMGHGKLNAELGKENDYTAAVEKFMASLDSEVAARLAR